MNYDVIIVGAGISGLICALEIFQDKSILVIEAGNTINKRNCNWEKTNICNNCNPCNLITGFGGCIKQGDSAKLSFPPSGKKLINRSNDCIEIAQYLNKEYFTNLTVSKTSKSFLSINLTSYPIAIIDSNKSTEILQNLESLISQRKNIQILYNTKVISFEKSACFTIKTQKGNFNSSNLVLAIGRYGKSFLNQIVKEKHLSINSTPCQIGVRFEMPCEILVNPGICHPDFKYKKVFNNEKVKTFCFCGGESGGIIKPLNYGNVQLLDGHIQTTTPSKKSNFALLHTVSKEEAEEILYKYIKQTNGKYISQKFQDFRKGSSGLSVIFPSKIRNNLVLTFIELFDLFTKNCPDYSLDDVDVFGLEIENDWQEIKTRNNFESLDISNLYICGDAAAIAQGLMQASIIGYIVAKSIH